MTLSRSNPRAKRRWFALGGAVTMMLLVLASAALASHPEVTLPGSNFEIDTNANLKLDDAAPSEDWASVPQGGGAGQERRKADEPTGANDDSFGNGTKEDTAVPSVIDGSIPNNKSDLLNFGAYLEEQADGD